MPRKTSPATREKFDKLVGFINNNGGSANVRQILANIFNNKTTDDDAVNAFHKIAFDDARFHIEGEGAAAIVTLVQNEAPAEDEPSVAAEAETVVINDEVPASPTPEPAKEEAPSADQAPNIDAKPGNELIVGAAVGLILAAISAPAAGGEILDSSVAAQLSAFKIEEIEEAIAKLFTGGLIEKEGQVDDSNLLVLTCAGWTEAMARQKCASDEEMAKKNDELRALHKHVAVEKELAEEVKACECDVEGAKARVSAAKKDLETANAKLAAFVRGDVQTSFLGPAPTPTGEVTAYEQGLRAYDPKKADAVNPYPADPQKSDWQRGYTNAKEQAATAPTLPAGNPLFEQAPKAPVRDASELKLHAEALDAALLDDMAQDEIRRGTLLAVKALPLFERDYLIVDAKGEEPNPCRYLAVPLYRQASSSNEWADLGHENKYGRCVEGIDQTEEAKTTRQTGGEFCGKVVKVGRKKCVVGPMSDAIVIEWTPPKDEEDAEEDDDSGVFVSADTDDSDE